MFCNGWVLIDKDKMSKSKGNFITLSDYCKRYSADGGRIAIANAGDTIENANIELKEADNGILKLSTLEVTIKDIMGSFKDLRGKSVQQLEFADSVFENKLKEIELKAAINYESMVFREVIKEVFFNMHHIREEYKKECVN